MGDRDAVERWLASPGPVARLVADGARQTGLSHAAVALAVDALVADGVAEWCNDGRRCALTALGAARRGLHVKGGRWSDYPEAPRPCDPRQRIVTETDILWGARIRSLRPDLANNGAPATLSRATGPEHDPHEHAVASEAASRLAREAAERGDYGPRVPSPGVVLGLGLPWPRPGQDRGPLAPGAGGRASRRRGVSCESCGSLRDVRVRRMAVAIPAGAYCAVCDASGMDHRLPPPRASTRRAHGGEGGRGRGGR